MHTRLLYDEFLRVPFVVKWPSQLSDFAPAVDSVVSLADLAPTLADGLAFILEDGIGFQGRTLIPTVFEGEPAHRLVFAQTHGVARADARPQPLRAVIGNESTLLHDETTDETELLGGRTGDFEAAYLLQQLQLQRQQNVVSFAEHVQQPEQELDEESIRRLRALGYVR